MRQFGSSLRRIIDFTEEIKEFPIEGMTLHWQADAGMNGGMDFSQSCTNITFDVNVNSWASLCARLVRQAVSLSQ